jgi:hypothetical protein
MFWEVKMWHGVKIWINIVHRDEEAGTKALKWR